MLHQRSLFDESDSAPSPNRHSTADTSREAYCRIMPHIGPVDQRALDAIRASGPTGMTREEVSRDTGMSIPTTTAAVNRLLKRKLIYQSGRRMTRSGSTANVVFFLLFVNRKRTKTTKNHATKGIDR